MDINNLEPKQIEALISMLQSMLPKEVADSSAETHTPKKQNNKKPRTNKKKISTNKFESMAEFNMHKSDTSIDKKLSQFPPVPRNREFNKLSVVCRTCGRKEEVSATLCESTDRYLCNRCCARGNT